MYKKILFSISIFAFLFACSEADSPIKYVFDAKHWEENIKKYTLGDESEDEFACMFGAMIFTDEVLKAVKAGKEPSISDDGTPTTINVYKNKIYWVAVDYEAEIINDKIILDFSDDGDPVELTLKRREDELLLSIVDENMDCDYPFKEIN
jgi:hypothetical protein